MFEDGRVVVVELIYDGLEFELVGDLLGAVEVDVYGAVVAGHFEGEAVLDGEKL